MAQDRQKNFREHCLPASSCLLSLFGFCASRQSCITLLPMVHSNNFRSVTLKCVHAALHTSATNACRAVSMQRTLAVMHITAVNGTGVSALKVAFQCRCCTDCRCASMSISFLTISSPGRTLKVPAWPPSWIPWLPFCMMHCVLSSFTSMLWMSCVKLWTFSVTR